MVNDLLLAILRHKRRLVAVLAIVLMGKVASTIPALILGRVVDEFAQSGDKSRAVTYLIGFVVIGLVNAVLMPAQGFYLTRFVQVLLRDASISAVRTLFGKSFELFSSLNIGKLLKSVERGVHASERLLNYLLATLLPLVTEFLVLVVCLGYLADLYFVLFVLILAALYIVVTHGIIKWRRSQLDELNDIEDEQAGVFANTFQAGKQIRLELARKTGLAPLDDSFSRYADAATEVGFNASLLGASKAVFIMLTTSVVLLYGIWSQRSGATDLTVGGFVALFTLTTLFFNCVFTLGEAYRFADQFAADYRRFKHLLEQDTFRKQNALASPGEVSQLVVPAGTLEFGGGVSLALRSQLTFGYREHIALVGPSGSGKTSLLELLAGVSHAAGPKVLLGNRRLDCLAEETLFRVVRYCPQMPRFLAGPVLSSVFFGDAPQEEAIKLFATALGVSHLFVTDPERSINEDASSISGGEAKRLSLLRVLLRPGEFNLFDEPTSSVDPRGASLIWGVLFERFAERNLICVTHDTQSLNRFDRVLVLDGGRVVADGPWAVLANDLSVMEVIERMESEAMQVVARGVE